MDTPHDSATAASTTEGLPVAPSLGPALEQLDLPHATEENRARIVYVSLLAIGAAIAAAFAAEVLVGVIALATNLAFYGRVSFDPVSPAHNHLGLGVIVVPVLGGIVVGFLARYGSAAIRGHGIPEAMERVLKNESRIDPKVTLLKPLSAAVAIGTGGPFGAEGPIIATGGALGSLLGQLVKITADERKILLAAGAAAGMAAVFSTPVAAVLLAIELLLFEYRARSLVPVALASSAATAIRMSLHGGAPVFPMADIAQPDAVAIVSYIVLGGVIGLLAAMITQWVYRLEDAFERLPIHWMWWPALGAVVVGVVGYVSPRTLGVGYDNIQDILTGSLAGTVLLSLVLLKLISWAVALSSGTSGGTLAPLFTIGGGLGSLIAAGAMALAPGLGMDLRVAGLVGMAAMFAGASRALLASIVFAFETTRQPMSLLPLLAGCSAAYLVSLLRMKHTIMTERLARRGTPVRTEYAADYLDQLLVRDHAAGEVVTLQGQQTLAEVRRWMAEGAGGASHQGFPVLDHGGSLIGVVTRRDLTDPKVTDETTVGSLIKRPPVIVFDDNTLRQAADHMVRAGVGRLPVVRRGAPRRIIGILSRSDLLEAHEHRLDAMSAQPPKLDIRPRWGEPRRER